MNGETAPIHVELYTKRPENRRDSFGEFVVECRRCIQAETVLRLLGVPHKVFFLEEYLLDSHEGWRTDGSVEKAAAFFMQDKPSAPFLWINGKGYAYKAGLQALEVLLRAAGKFPEGVDLNIDGECHGTCSIGGAPAAKVSAPDAPVLDVVRR